jgi:hypothetical protein
MSELSFGKLIVPALLTTGAVFTALSAPVVMFAETPLTINQGKANLYSGPVRDAALPYLMLAGATSVGLGISGVAMAGWRKSAKRAESLSQAIDTQQQQRRVEREAHLKATLASESYLAKSGLDFFLEDGELTPFAPEKLAVAQALPVPALVAPPIAAPIASAIAAPIDDLAAHLDWLDGGDAVVAVNDRPQLPIARPARPMSVRPPASTPVPTPVPQSQSAAPLTAAQGFYGFSRGQEGQRSAPVPPQVAAQDQMTIARIQSLQTQLQAIVTQIESLQSNLPTTAAPIQVVEDVSLVQSGLVQSEFKPQAAPAEMHRDSVQYARRVAS